MFFLALLALLPQHAERLSMLEERSGWHMNEKGERVRDPKHLPGRDVSLFDGKSLAGWHLVGDASFSVDGDSILGQTSNGKANSFLVSDASYGDFLLEVDVKNEQPGNSGIQIRSKVVGTEPRSSYASGYQIEIDPSARAWSGGLYEERARGWLQNLEKNEEGRKAFHSGEWNHYRIECIGPWIRASVNGVSTADWLDPVALDGIFGLQVHAGQDTKVRWRNFALHVYGKHEWKPLDAKTLCATGAKLGPDFGLRLVRDSAATAPLKGWTLHLRATKPEIGADDKRPRPAITSHSTDWTIDLDAPLFDEAKEKRTWHELTVLFYADRFAVHREGELVIQMPKIEGPPGPDGPLVWIEKPADADISKAFARVESLEPVSR
jgi:Domain of Unknown Function (DUF1080)